MIFRRKARRGNAATLAASLLTLVGASAFVVDVGFLYASQTRLQAGVDAAVLAGVGYFDGTADGLTLAREKTVEYGGKNNVMGAALAIPLDAVETGFIDDDRQFVASTDPKKVNAISVNHTKVDVPVFFSAVVFGRSSLAANAHSVAMNNAGRPAGAVACPLPLSVPDCVFDIDADQLGDLVLQLSSANQDNAGWADMSGRPNANGVRDQLNGECQEGDGAQAGDPVYLQNGVIASAIAEIANILNGENTEVTSPWDEERLGTLPPQDPISAVNADLYGSHVLSGPIAVFDAGEGDCLSSLQFNQSRPVTGFVWASIYDVKNSGKNKNIMMRIDRSNPYVVGSGGGGHEDSNIKAPGTGTLVY